MKDTDTPFERALISTIRIDNPKNVKTQVTAGVIKKCIERGLLCEEDKRIGTKMYKWVCRVIDNDFAGLCLLRKETSKVVNSSDLKDLFADVDDICEDVIARISNRILSRNIELKST
ncbi:hypothetical protein NOK74_24020 [Vibrio parahaemolyticus]|uniref:hypothetical protein n=1 Tax=Vibrio parahaemolyticus TaxID=670 RepID=UPI002269D3BB|nr:hypothetical protein [Vibrio parahaemolyticus]MCX8875273.1 hypothetical protein [Vibrio parahaemolyticus]